tara:strand:+ start:593 stop:1435 length:843 start_codon:yes stop_codon:yes gene_type:complete
MDSLKPLNIVFLKIGFLGSTLLPEVLLDERATRKDINIYSFSTGCNMNSDNVERIVKISRSFDPHLIIFISPAMEKEQIKKSIKLLTNKVPVIAITDSSSHNFLLKSNFKNFGYILFEADSLIGARMEFLDPIETAIFNSDLLKVLSITGALRLFQEVIDSNIQSLKKGHPIDLPKIIVDDEKAISYSQISNPYAISKALASYNIASTVSKLSSRGIYKTQDREKYVPLVSAAHEIMRIAAQLADESREIEKTCDDVVRKPHIKDGSTLSKRKLFDKASK